jgi:DNA-binding transcriptional ArsR family regulator
VKYETCNVFPELVYSSVMASWSFLTNHARALLCIAHDPGVRLRDLAAMVGVTERSAHGIVADLVDAGYVVKDKDGRRNRYRIQEHLPLRDPIAQERAIGEMLDLLVGVNAHRNTHNQDRTHHG